MYKYRITGFNTSFGKIIFQNYQPEYILCDMDDQNYFQNYHSARIDLRRVKNLFFFKNTFFMFKLILLNHFKK